MRNSKGQFIKGYAQNIGKHWKVKDSSNMGTAGKENNFYKDGRCENKREYNRQRLIRIRLATLEALGAKCVRCGFNDKRALQIDHINGGGSKERKIMVCVGSYSKKVINSFLKGENKYQLLCANCNWIKRVENGETKRKYFESEKVIDSINKKINSEL